MLWLTMAVLEYTSVAFLPFQAQTFDPLALSVQNAGTKVGMLIVPSKACSFPHPFPSSYHRSKCRRQQTGVTFGDVAVMLPNLWRIAKN